MVEAPRVVDVENFIADNENDTTILLQNQQDINPSVTLSTEDEKTPQIETAAEIETDLSDTGADRNNTIESIEKHKLNLTEENTEIPVFSEWAQKRLEEVEKEVEQEIVNTSTMKKNMPPTNKQPVLKLKNSKNYASPDCGAKIIAANAESDGTGHILTSTRDQYMLSTCISKIWFVVELCEAIQAERIDLANFELFSSSPKNFSVGVSSRFPTRDWSNVGKFVAKDERYIQSFDLYPHLFGKYVRVDVHSHYNSEHFCPISLFRVYGTSEFEAFETENRQHPIDDIDDDDDDNVDQEFDANKGKTNIFKSASDAVMSIVDTVKKAASFVKPNGNKTNDNDLKNGSNSKNSKNNCISPNHAIDCENCSDDMTREVTALVECKQNLLKRLLSIDIIKNSIHKSHICNTLIASNLNINCSEPTDVNSTTSDQLTDLQMDYIINLFSLKYITAMCNLLVATDRKVAWNSTIPIDSDLPINVTIDQMAGDHLLPNAPASVKPKPSIQIIQNTHQIEKRKSTSKESLKVPIERQFEPHLSTSSSKKKVVSTDENNIENSKNEATPLTMPLPAIGSCDEIADKTGHNIFNVVDPVDLSEEMQVVLVEKTTTEPVITSGEQGITPPAVLIPPDIITPTPKNDLNDASEEQTSNGWTNTPQFGQKLHSESVFLRLSNRVKVKEIRNHNKVYNSLKNNYYY